MAIIDKPSDFFKPKLYTGNGSSSHGITGVGFAPNWTWIKERSQTESHFLFDAVRGNNKYINSNGTGQEYTESGGMAFNSDGFTLGSWNSVNESNIPYVSWNWKAGTSFTNDASGTSIGSIDSAGSVNQDAGFSIISYTGTGSNGTIAHGLGVVPAWIIHKRRNDTSGWVVWHKSIGTNIMELNETGAAQGGSSYINGTVPTSSVFSVGTSGDINASGGTYIAYCFAEKKGYSKFGSYVANSGGANSTFVYLGFKPAWIMVKKSSGTQSWYIGDNKRLGYNPKNENVNADTNGVEFSQDNWDVLSNGFKIKNNGAGVGTGGDTYIYMAFAEQPFVTSTGVPATAR